MSSLSSAPTEGHSVSEESNPAGSRGEAGVSDSTEARSRIPKTLALTLGALGVVYGDVGTSPLYAVKECFHGMHAIAVSHQNVMGVLSLVFWSLTMVVTVKYVGFILRADNKGEGGIYALLALIPMDRKTLAHGFNTGIVLAGIFGAALLYGDGVITPAISVLSAIEGLEVATKAAASAVIPLTCIVLFLLFTAQRFGTAGIGRFFGPILLAWFVVIGALGANELIRSPQILMAVNPAYAVDFFALNKMHGMIVLGSVVLCITGGEALYADLGHFGSKAIRISWLAIAFPALLLNYFGQGALILENPELASNPFYGLVPRAILYPMVALATMAAVIASQAMISGVFSLTQQAVQLGFLPRVQIVHTSGETRGQIYVPQVNWTLMLACIGLVLVFGNSSRLAAAYGIAVTATMGITSILYFFLLIRGWKWPLWKAVPLVALFLAFDLAFFGANLLKVLDGGWFTIAIAICITIVMITWRDGRAALARRMLQTRMMIEPFVKDVAERLPHRVPGTAVFLTVSAEVTPLALLHFYKHAHVLHEQVILLSIKSVDEPVVPAAERLRIDEFGCGFYRLIASYGFMERPNVPVVLQLASEKGLRTQPASTTYFLGRETLLTSGPSEMMHWRKNLFAAMSRNAQSAMGYFNIPVDRVVELGIQVAL
ncbi:MAG: potassium transporter Kup [Desulfobacteraceae bacterium]|nr:potassium transporter Kup [Desulfobacteraceae bacterium]